MGKAVFHLSLKKKIPSKLEVAPPLSKMLSGWMGDGVDTPLTLMTTRAPAVLKMIFCTMHRSLEVVL